MIGYEDDEFPSRPEDEFLEDLKAFYPHMHIEDINDYFDDEYEDFAPVEDAEAEYYQLQKEAAADREVAQAALKQLKESTSNNNK